MTRHLAARFLAAARNAWTWAVANPNVVFANPPGVTTGDYGDRQVADELMWASAELWRTTGEPQYEQQFLKGLPANLNDLHIDAPSWGTVSSMACWTYALAASAGNAGSKAAIRAKTHETAQALIQRSHTYGYANTLALPDYGWGSNGTAGNQSLLLAIDHHFNPNRDAVERLARQPALPARPQLFWCLVGHAGGQPALYAPASPAQRRGRHRRSLARPAVRRPQPPPRRPRREDRTARAAHAHVDRRHRGLFHERNRHQLERASRLSARFREYRRKSGVKGAATHPQEPSDRKPANERNGPATHAQDRPGRSCRGRGRMVSEQTGMQLWGGLECTVNRVGDTWMDQLHRSGHYGRSDDSDRIAALGIRTLRYGLHWERFCAAGTLEIFAKPLAAMQRAGIEPIVGLVHHGSGPADTDLLDPGFPEKLAVYARQLAERFPELRLFTPVNEPQTTARFSALYGHWYPHVRSFAGYARALVNQLKATVLSMRAIRAVRPDAQFVSTEDGGKTWSTESLRALCDEREARRWAGLDLLCGRVDRGHPIFAFLLTHGIPEHEILWFAENPCPPDIIGLNYYLTSDRFLDHRVENYPDWLAGGDAGLEPLVDIEAVRLRRDGIAGAGHILTEAWNRYKLPVAITECHLGGC